MCAVIYHAAELLLLLPDLFVVLYIGTFGELGTRIAQNQVFLLLQCVPNRTSDNILKFILQWFSSAHQIAV